MSASCGTCGADYGTVGVVKVKLESRLCEACLKREGIEAPKPNLTRVELSREPKPKLPLRSDKWEIDYGTTGKPEGTGWWLIGTHAVMHPDTDDHSPHLELVCVYARRKVVEGSEP